MTLPPLFLYGTLRDPDILAAVLGRTVVSHLLVVAAAPGYAAVYYPDRLYPALVQRTGGIAPGLLLTNATAEDLAALDAFEGDEYRRGFMQVMTSAGPISAAVYWPAIRVPPTAREWTLETWTLDHKPEVLLREAELGRAARRGTARR